MREDRMDLGRLGALVIGCTVAAVLAASSGCGSERSDSPVDDTIDDPRPSHSTGQPEEGHGEVPNPPPAQMHALEGTVTMNGAAVRAGAAIEAEQTIEVPEGGRAVLQMRDGGRVELAGGTIARILGEGDGAVAFVRGSLYAVQPPMGNAPRAPLRVVSPSASIEIGTAGEIYAVFFETGSSWVAVLGGAAAINTGEADNRRQLRVLDLPAHQAVAVTSRMAEPTEGPTRLTAAREAGAVLAAAEGDAAPDAERLQREVGHEVERLDQALHWLETEARRGRELTNEHRDAIHEHNEDESRRIQRELVNHSQELYRLRRLATARWERTRALALRATVVGGSRADDPIAERRDRVIGLLGQ